MKPLLSLILVSSLSVVCSAQNHENNSVDTIYLDSEGYYVGRSQAETYIAITPDGKGGGAMRKCNLATNAVIKEGYYSDIDSLTYEGPFVGYYESGNVEWEVVYHNDEEVGRTAYYYDTSAKLLWHKCRFEDGIIDGELTSYYRSGALKRREIHKILIDDAPGTGTADSGKVEPVRKDTIVFGECYDENGGSIKFTPFFIAPTPPENFNRFLTKNIKYPRKARRNEIEGRVMLRFMVDVHGKVQNVTLLHNVSPEIDAEAVRVIKKSPIWIPGIRDDEVVDAYMKLPLRFRLE